MFELCNIEKELQKMKIKVYANYEFTDFSNNCYENGKLSIEYEVPKSWARWSEEQKEDWFERNIDKMQKRFDEAMCIGFPSYFLE